MREIPGRSLSMQQMPSRWACFFAGGIDASGVGQGLANPAPDVLSELSAQLGGGSTYSFVGGQDHAVSCLNYGENTIGAAQNLTLTGAENTRALQAMSQARSLINSSTGILGVGVGKAATMPAKPL